MEKFVTRHNGPCENDIAEMLTAVGVSSIEQLIDQTMPADIRLPKPLNLEKPLSEYAYLNKIKEIAGKNKIYKSFIGMGYYRTYTPAVIQRNIFENPSWYTSYTPYQAEVSQGRLEALLNFQTMVTGLTAMETANCSLLDEATAAAEAMHMMFELRSRQAVKDSKNVLFVDDNVFPQTKDVILTRAEPLGIVVDFGKFDEYVFGNNVFGAIVQYPCANGEIRNYSDFCTKAHEKEVLVTAIADLLALAVIKAPGEWGADIAVGTTQRFGIPMGYGGPAAGYMATKDAYKRSMPGRIIGISVDRLGKTALRMALQTREQHIKREKATSNICTAQALLATMAGMYGVYHGPEGIKAAAMRAHKYATKVSDKLGALGYQIACKNFFDTVEIKGVNAAEIRKAAEAKQLNFYYPDEQTVRMSFDEVTRCCEIHDIMSIFVNGKAEPTCKNKCEDVEFSDEFKRTSTYMTETVFNRYRSETEMMRYIKKLERRDISLADSMIPLGSCTMKLNAAAEMLPLSWAELGAIHPFAPQDQAEGYKFLINDLAKDIAEITGFDSVSFQPNSGAAGEYAGLMVIRQYHISRGEGHRTVAIIPSSAHGTNPASAAMAGMKIVVTACDEKGNIDVDDFRAKAEEHKNDLSCAMITYPSTHGVFEKRIREIIDIVHKNGGQLYLDGANMNAQTAFTSPGYIGSDVCHLNLHKTFAIPHGGGGPGEGPICVAKHLTPFLSGHTIVNTGSTGKPVSSAPYGSAMILPITYGYIKMLGEEGLRKVTATAILNANYISKKLEPHYNTLYTGETGRVGHECIIDMRDFSKIYGVDATDIAKRLMDFGFHAPTLSFPVANTLMVEPTESESKQELDRFIEAMITIKQECEDIKSGKADKEDNPIKMAPHTCAEVTADEWKHPYTRTQAAFPAKWIEQNKFWPYVTRIDNGYGDRNLVCSCAPIEDYK